MNCPYPWGGQWCHICARETCQNGYILNATLSSGKTIRDANGKVVQVKDTSKLQCFGAAKDDCTCCCNSIFSSPAEDSRYSMWRYTGDHCETLPNFCPGGTKSSGSMVPPNYSCAPCQGNWEGRLCDECKAQCYHGSNVGNAYCQCECESGWRHQLDAGGKGQCDVCIPRAVGGPTCPEDESNMAVGFSCHNNFKSKKRSGKCGANERLCLPSEVAIATKAGSNNPWWFHFSQPDKLISPQPVKCFTAFSDHAKGASWGSAKVYIVDPETRHVHATFSHTAGGSQAQKICLPARTYQMYLCDEYASYPETHSWDRITWYNQIDISGNMQYVINIGGGSWNEWRADWEVPGFSVWAQYWHDWGKAASLGYGPVEYMFRVLRWSGYPNGVHVTANVDKGQYYKMQLLFMEGCCNRGFDIFVNDVRVMADFAPYSVAGSTNIGYARYTRTFVAPSGTLTVVLRSRGNYPDNNPILSGFTLERIGLGQAKFHVPNVLDWTVGKSMYCNEATPYTLNLQDPNIGVSCPQLRLHLPRR